MSLSTSQIFDSNSKEIKNYKIEVIRFLKNPYYNYSLSSCNHYLTILPIQHTTYNLQESEYYDNLVVSRTHLTS